MALPSPFFLVVVDADRQAFSVEGPMRDDTPWVAAVCRSQASGRDVTCSTWHGASADHVAQQRQSLYGGKRLEPGSIVRPSLDDYSTR